MSDDSGLGRDSLEPSPNKRQKIVSFQEPLVTGLATAAPVPPSCLAQDVIRLQFGESLQSVTMRKIVHADKNAFVCTKN